MDTPADVRRLLGLKQELERDLDVVRRALELLGEAPSSKATFAPAPPEDGKFAGLGLQEALEGLFSGNPTKRFTTREAANELLAHGLITKSKVFISTVGSALHRMHAKGLVEKVRKGRRKAYIWKDRTKMLPGVEGGQT